MYVIINMIISFRLAILFNIYSEMSKIHNTISFFILVIMILLVFNYPYLNFSFKNIDKFFNNFYDKIILCWYLFFGKLISSIIINHYLITSHTKVICR